MHDVSCGFGPHRTSEHVFNFTKAPRNERSHRARYNQHVFRRRLFQGLSIVAIAADGEPGRSPLLSFWFRPGDTIETVLAGRPRLSPSLLLLTAGGVAHVIVLTQVTQGMTSALLDWRALAVDAIGAFVVGTVSLFVCALFLSWS